MATFNLDHSQLNLGVSFVMKMPGTSPISPKICAPLHIPKTDHTKIPIVEGGTTNSARYPNHQFPPIAAIFPA